MLYYMYTTRGYGCSYRCFDVELTAAAGRSTNRMNFRTVAPSIRCRLSKAHAAQSGESHDSEAFYSILSLPVLWRKDLVAINSYVSSFPHYGLKVPLQPSNA